MILDKYEQIRFDLIPDCKVPEEFFLPGAGNETYCIFMISCLSSDKFLYLDKNFGLLTGYSNEQFIKEGMDFWFSLVCAEDMEAVTARIIEAHKAMFSPGFDPGQPTPLVLEYRFKHASGHWVTMRDTRYLVSYNEDKVIDKVLCRFEAISATYADINDLSDLLRKEKSCTKMLEMAMVHQNSRNKQPLDAAQAPVIQTNPPFVNELTRREREILQLISEGLSTKMIADRCFISIHTVETHRRHLLEKLKVKNSMELIKEASKVFWL